MHFKLVSILLWFLVILPGAAQIIPFHNYTVENGLPSNVVYDIEQDQKGFLWFGTQAGAVRFDGYNFVTYDVNSGLPGNMIKEIFIDNENNIWFGTQNEGLALKTPSYIKTFSTNDGLISNAIKYIFQDSINNIWCITDQGISIIQSDTIINYHREKSPFKNTILNYYIAANGSIFLSSLDGLFVYNDNSFTEFKKKELGYLITYDITEDKPGSYWFATENRGVINYSEKSGIKVFDKNSGLHTNIAYSLHSPEPGIIIAGTVNGGIYKFRNDVLEQSWTSGLDNIIIDDIISDKSKRIWCTTKSHGIILIQNDLINYITKKNQLVFDKPSKIFEDYSGNIWISTWNGLSMYGKIIFEQYNTDLLNNDKNIISVEYLNSKIYLGTYGGYNIIDFKSGISSFPLTNNKGFSVGVYSLEGSQNTLWMGINGGLAELTDRGVTSYSSNVMSNYNLASAFDIALLHDSLYLATEIGLIRFYNESFKLISNHDKDLNGIYSVALDPSKNIWCGAANGLAIYDGTEFHNYNTSNGLPHNFCNDIAFDSKGKAWIATDNGISQVTIAQDWNIECKNYGTGDGLTSGLVFLITADDKDKIWTGHNKGLDKFDPVTKQFNHYGKAEGFLPIETFLGAVTHGDNGEIWFGTVDGAVRYLPDNDRIYTDEPKVYITDVKLYGDSTTIFQMADSINPETGLPVNLQLNYNQNNLVFDYVGLHYTIIEKNAYRYILEGYDQKWSEITKEISTPPYRKLPHGKYTFKVRAANCDGIWNSYPAEFSFEIRPPFWKTTGFYILEIILGLVFFWLVMYIRVRRLQAEKIRLTQKVKERTIEIEKQRDQIAHQKQEITDSIEYAEKIQRAVLPNQTVINEFMPEHFILFRPRDIVSGDFYWINREKDKVVVVAADCTGHGVPGAFMSMLGVSILNEIASKGSLPQANTILDILREHLTQTLRQTGQEDEAKDGMDLCLIILDSKTLQLQYSGAYNPLILVRNKEAVVYKADKMPVGFHFGEMGSFTLQEIQLEKGDCIYMFSDGYADQFGGPNGKKFKSANLRKLLCEISPLNMDEQKEQLNATMEKWMEHEDQIDDMLVIGIRV